MTRLAELETKLRAREGQPAYKKNVEALKKEIERLKNEPVQ